MLTLPNDGYTWNRHWCEERIAELHVLLETPGMDKEATDLLRGQIQNARRLLEDSRKAAGITDGR
jgi:hypothetical protein